MIAVSDTFAAPVFVACNDPKAADRNPGTEAAPFRLPSLRPYAHVQYERKEPH